MKRRTFLGIAVSLIAAPVAVAQAISQPKKLTWKDLDRIYNRLKSNPPVFEIKDYKGEVRWINNLPFDKAKLNRMAAKWRSNHNFNLKQ